MNPEAAKYIHWYGLDDKGEPFPLGSDLVKILKGKKGGERCRQMWGSPFRRVHHTKVGRYIVCTDFLFLDHGMVWTGGHAPIYWETMVLGGKRAAKGKLYGEMDRCGGSREQAEAMHWEMCARVARSEKVKRPQPKVEALP